MVKIAGSVDLLSPCIYLHSYSALTKQVDITAELAYRYSMRYFTRNSMDSFSQSRKATLVPSSNPSPPVPSGTADTAGSTSNVLNGVSSSASNNVALVPPAACTARSADRSTEPFTAGASNYLFRESFAGGKVFSSNMLDALLYQVRCIFNLLSGLLSLSSHNRTLRWF